MPKLSEDEIESRGQCTYVTKNGRCKKFRNYASNYFCTVHLYREKVKKCEYEDCDKLVTEFSRFCKKHGMIHSKMVKSRRIIHPRNDLEIVRGYDIKDLQEMAKVLEDNENETIISISKPYNIEKTCKLLEYLNLSENEEIEYEE